MQGRESCGSTRLVHWHSKPFSMDVKERMTEQKAPRGRPPHGAVLVEGRWKLTDEAIEKAAARLEKHRADCRERYRRTQDVLKEQRPELFSKRNGKRRRAGAAVRESQLPLSDCILQGASEEGYSSATGRRGGICKVQKREASVCTTTEVLGQNCSFQHQPPMGSRFVGVHVPPGKGRRWNLYTRPALSGYILALLMGKTIEKCDPGNDCVRKHSARQRK